MRLGWFRQGLAVFAITAMGLGGSLAGVAHAQVQSIDPNDAIDADLQSVTRSSEADPVTEGPLDQGYDYGAPDSGVANDSVMAPPPATPAQPGLETVPPAPGKGYQKDDLIGAAEGVFGKGAEGLAGLIEDILRKQGEPNGYIVGREASGAFVVGFRYGSGTLHHKVEGERPVYWTGPSIGFDAGANAGNTFVLVYNLYDSEDLFKRFGAGEGAAYLIGGFHTSYLRRGDVVLIPVRMGLGLRLGVNAGYMKFTRNRNFVPF
ncbi:DUF1134 domain-containing protein [Blastomonas sp. AAP53]|uniref:DUF1134 domain-containing protein n=1 Tax=Blastomonas sp. AAP53 TaxID=1248760 RepID=UPI000683D84A|nr:DUF1134 domain-containing protein [Blastomonas sp. AAP53]